MVKEKHNKEFEVIELPNGKFKIKCPHEKDEKGNIKIFVPNISEVQGIINNGKRKLQ